MRSAENFAYGDLIDQIRLDHPDHFEFIPFLTGGRAPDGGFDCRMTGPLADGRLEKRVGLTLDPDRSHVMLCGHSGMISDAVTILEGRGLRRHRRREPGHISTEKYH